MKVEPIVTAAPLRSTRWLDILPFVLLVVSVVILARQPPGNDAAWQLWIGRSLSEGSRLYRDIIEINPPLWFWIAVPIVRAAAALHITSSAALIAFLGLSAAGSLLLSYRLLDERRALVGSAMVFVFFFAGLSATGQREQFTLIATAPYVLLCARRAEGQPVALWLALLVGSWAALGICLKPFFVLLPAALELWLTIRRGLRPSPEFLAIAALGATYLGATALIYPAYFAEVMPLVRANYGRLNRSVWYVISSETAQIAGLAGLTFLLARQRSERAQAFAVAGLAFLIAFLLQMKGWRYHGLPAIGFFALLAVECLRQPRAAILAVPTLLLTLATTLSERTEPYAPTMAATRDMRPGTSILILSEYASPAWPTVELRRLRWSSPYMFLWMRNDRAFLERVVLQDILSRPDRILIDRHLHLLSDARVRQALADYERGPTYRWFDSYDRK